MVQSFVVLHFSDSSYLFNQLVETGPQTGDGPSNVFVTQTNLLVMNCGQLRSTLKQAQQALKVAMLIQQHRPHQLQRGMLSEAKPPFRAEAPCYYPVQLEFQRKQILMMATQLQQTLEAGQQKEHQHKALVFYVYPN